MPLATTEDGSFIRLPENSQLSLFLYHFCSLSESFYSSWAEAAMGATPSTGW